MLRRGEVRKLVLVRPAVEAGEKLGFLPGDLQEKVNPYLRPLLDALHDMMEYEQVQRFLSCDIIEICPLAFMRGRTLNDAVIILDEAQNTTKSQMLMFLTPVFWLPESLPDRAKYMLWNPFAQLLDLLRTPLMGGVAHEHSWFGMLGWTAANIVVAAVLFRRYRRRVTFWL